MLIPKVIFQTSRDPLPESTIAMLFKNVPSDWKYCFFNDADIIRFFNENPIDEFPDIVSKWHSFERGAHRADLFRYYYLYVNGGMFLDSDAMLYSPIEPLLDSYEFVSVNSTHIPQSIFQGILAAIPKSPIIKEALMLAYTTENGQLERDYHCFCRQMYRILEGRWQNVKLYNEVRNGDHDIIMNDNTIIFKHFWKTKTVPLYFTQWNEYNKEELHTFPYTVLTTYEIPGTLVRVGPPCDGGHVIVDGLNYDLFLSCGIVDHLLFEDAFLEKYPIPCLAFDGTINSLPRHSQSLHWEKKNISFVTSPTTTNLKEHLKWKNIFLNMDIEGCEYDWINSMTTEDLSCFSQIVMEIHWPFDTFRASMLAKLNQTHYLVHLHGNNYCDRDIPKGLPSGRTYDGTVTIRCEGLKEITLPEVFEATYVRKDLFEAKPVEIQFPTALDFPCNRSAKDISFSIPCKR